MSLFEVVSGVQLDVLCRPVCNLRLCRGGHVSLSEAVRGIVWLSHQWTAGRGLCGETLLDTSRSASSLT